MPRLKKKESMPDYNPTPEELEAYRYCMTNDIRISPGCVYNGTTWAIDIYAKGKWNRSPKTFGRDEIWEVFYNYCKYYYENVTKRKLLELLDNCEG